MLQPLVAAILANGVTELVALHFEDIKRQDTRMSVRFTEVFMQFWKQHLI